MKCLLLIGFQNDYFSGDGQMHASVENRIDINTLKTRTIRLLKNINKNFLIVAAPIGFTQNYSDMGNTYGILELIRDKNAFIVGTSGYQTIKDITDNHINVNILTHRRTLNAFQNTDLIKLLTTHGVNTLYLAGIFTSLCIDSTARTSYELGYKTYILSDLIAGINEFENKYYLENIFPSYAICETSDELLAKQ
jgi:nicotinamidase-related amidase